MKKENSKQINIRVSAEDAKIIKEVIRLEKSNVEAYRVTTNSGKTEYEKRLNQINDRLMAV